MDDSSSRGKVYSRHETGQSNFASSALSLFIMYCPGETVFMKPASEHTRIIRRSSGRLSTFCLYSCSRLPRARSLIRSGCVVVYISGGETTVSGSSSATSFPCWQGSRKFSNLILHTDVRDCSVNTEQIDWNDSGKNNFNSFRVTTEVCGQFSTSCASQSSSFWRTCSTEFGMSAFHWS